MRANFSQQRQRERETYLDGEERHHADHHRPTLPQDYYSSNAVQTVGPADLVPAERVSPYGRDLYTVIWWWTDSLWMFSVSQQRAWLNPPTQVGSGMRQLDGTDGKSTSLDPDVAGQDSTIFEKSNVLLIGPTGSGNHHSKDRKSWLHLNLSDWQEKHSLQKLWHRFSKCHFLCLMLHHSRKLVTLVKM